MGGIINLTLIVLRSLKGRCYGNYFGNQLIWGAFLQTSIWPPPVFSLAFWKEMQHRYLHKGINTSDDAATSRKNLVNP